MPVPAITTSQEDPSSASMPHSHQNKVGLEVCTKSECKARWVKNKPSGPSSRHYYFRLPLSQPHYFFSSALHICLFLCLESDHLPDLFSVGLFEAREREPLAQYLLLLI